MQKLKGTPLLLKLISNLENNIVIYHHIPWVFMPSYIAYEDNKQYQHTITPLSPNINGFLNGYTLRGTIIHEYIQSKNPTYIPEPTLTPHIPFDWGFEKRIVFYSRLDGLRGTEVIEYKTTQSDKPPINVYLRQCGMYMNMLYTYTGKQVSGNVVIYHLHRDDTVSSEVLECEPYFNIPFVYKTATKIKREIELMGGYQSFLQNKFKNHPNFNPTIYIHSKQLVTSAPFKKTTPSVPEVKTVSEALSHYFGVKVIPHGNWVYEMGDTGTIFYLNEKLEIINNDFTYRF